MPTPSQAHDVPVLFLSGAGLPAWIWDDVRAQLPTTTTAVAERPRHARASLADYADAAATTSWPSFLVVAHSSGGVVAAELLARHPSRVAGILGVSAVVPRPGASFVSTMPLPGRAALGLILRLVGTRPPEKFIRAGLGHGLPEPTVNALVADFTPESVGLYRDRTSAWDLPRARAYIRTTQDREISDAVQQRSVTVLKSAWSEDLPCGHLPMLEDPHAISTAITRLVDLVH